MKVLVVFYSRTNMTRRLGMVLADALAADIEDVQDKVSRSGVLGYIMAGRDATLRRLTEIDVEKDPARYDLVIIGTPVWGFNMCPAIRTYLTKFKNRMKGVAFFCTSHGTGSSRALKEMEALSGRKAEAVLDVLQGEMERDAFSGKVDEFLRKLKGK